MAESLSSILRKPSVKTRVILSMALPQMKREILASRPNSSEELLERIEDYLTRHPDVDKRLLSSEITAGMVASRLSAYAQ